MSWYAWLYYGVMSGLVGVSLFAGLDIVRSVRRERRAVRRRTEDAMHAMVAQTMAHMSVTYEHPAPTGTALPLEENAPLVRGWREYNFFYDRDGLELDGNSLMLTGVTRRPWEGPEMQATCGIGTGEAVPSGPHLRGEQPCASSKGCGIYMTKRPPMAALFAECIGWGACVEHEKGYRVEHCRIEKLYLRRAAYETDGREAETFRRLHPTFEHMVDVLKARYQVPVEVTL